MWNEHAIQSNKICNRSSVCYLDQHMYIKNQTDKLKQPCKLKQKKERKKRKRKNIRKICWPEEDGKRTQNNSTTSTEIIFNRSKTKLTLPVPVFFVSISYFVHDEDKFCQKGWGILCPCPGILLVSTFSMFFFFLSFLLHQLSIAFFMQIQTKPVKSVHTKPTQGMDA